MSLLKVDVRYVRKKYEYVVLNININNLNEINLIRNRINNNISLLLNALLFIYQYSHNVH